MHDLNQAAASATPRDLASVLSEPRFKNLMRERTPEEYAEEERHERRRVLAERSDKRERLIFRLFGEGSRYESLTLDDFRCDTPEQQAVVDALREYAGGIHDRIRDREGLLFYGPSGTGKDHLALGVCIEAIESSVPCARINGSEWFGELRDAMDGNVPESGIIRRLADPKAILLISDPLPPFGDLTQYQATMLYRLVEARYFAGSITFVTLNVADGAEAEKRMGAATWDRLKDKAWVMACNWPSYRKPARIIGA